MQFLRTLAGLVQNLNVRDVVDIVAVATVFFLLFYLLRISRSLMALRSLIYLMLTTILLYVVARMFELSAMSMIFDRFWTVIVIIYLIVYQSSFRRAFQEVAQIRLVRALIRAGSGHIDTLVRAVMRLSEKQLGALFVLQRRNDVMPHVVSPGTEIDAVISEELIVTIFFSYNPLHDGAVLIANDRLVRANMTLPISKSTNVPKGLGTRHRAAMEISELCDAVVVVVSEETGAVSFVEGGRIDRGLDEDGLQRALRRALNVRLDDKPTRKEEE